MNEEKKTTLFGVLPNLFETTPTGEVIEIAESDAIENYLSRKFNLLGNDPFDEMKIRAYCSSIQSASNFLLIKVAGIKDPEVKAAMRTQFIETIVPRFVTYHERHLEANGRNGHYVGDKVNSNKAIPFTFPRRCYSYVKIIEMSDIIRLYSRFSIQHSSRTRTSSWRWCWCQSSR